MEKKNFNILDLLRELAARRPEHLAVIYIRNDGSELRWSYAELDRQADIAAAGLRVAGVGSGARVLILARPDEHFIPFIFGLLRAGAVAVLVDPGRPLAEFLQCVREAEITALVAPAMLQALSLALPGVLGGVRARIVTAGRFPGAIPLERVLQAQQSFPFQTDTLPSSPAAVLFTTGSTGKPKGVVFDHLTLLHQTQALQAGLRLRDEDIGLFGPSAMMLLGLASGVTVLMAEKLGDSPSRVDLSALAETLISYQVTLSFASPELCRRLVKFCEAQDITFPALRQLMVGGAPLSVDHIAALRRIMPGGDAMLSLGSTEAIPVTIISGAEVLRKSSQPDRQNCGTCAGYPAAGHALRILPITDTPIAAFDASTCLPPETIGEIIVRGPVVTRAYLKQPEQDALAKIPDGEDVWHRMGDLGFLDAEGCLWYCGRKSQRVVTAEGTLYTIPCEMVFNRHPGVARCALVGRGARGMQTPVVVVETLPDGFPQAIAEKNRFVAELLELARQDSGTRGIQAFAFYPGVFPVDIRHNSKISREKLAAWVERHPQAVLQGG